MDAYCLFVRMAPELVELNATTGTPAGFPLEPLSFVPGYRRLSPEWPSEEDADRWLVQRVRHKRPAGVGRHICNAFVHDDDGLMLCGWTDHASYNYKSRFVEPATQVAIDVTLGYPYFCSEVAGASTQVDVDVLHDLRVAGQLIKDIGLTVGGQEDADWPRDVNWPAHYKFLADNADLYRDERLQAYG